MAKVQPRALISTVLSHLALIGLIVVFFLATVALVSVALGKGQLLDLVIALMVLTVGVIAVDTNRQVRRNAQRLIRGANRAPRTIPTTSPKQPTIRGDAGGLARVLQAQYVGRLDRAQASFERAAEALHQQSADAGREAHSLVPGPEAAITVHRVDEDVFPAILAAAHAGRSVLVRTDDVGKARARLAEAGLAGAVTFVDPAQDTPAVTISLIP